MRIWLMTIGEPLPIDEGAERLLRTGILAERLSRSGHDVVWWTSAFDHRRKCFRAANDLTVQVDAHLKLRMLRGTGYRRNLSVRRLIDHRAVARRFRADAGSETVPDAILCSLPTIELSVEAVRYGRRHRVPVVLDVRDLWPDVILDAVPGAIRPAARRWLAFLFEATREACSEATAMTGITDEVVDWAVGYAGRDRGPLDRAFPMGYTQQSPPSAQVARAREFWRRWKVTGERDEFVACFFGTIGRHFEFDTVFKAAQLLADRSVRFVLCGTGPGWKRWSKRTAAFPNVVMPGWVDSAAVWTLLRMSAVGLAPYRSTWDFTKSIPNKPIEYLSAGLPIVSTLKGTLANLLQRHECGTTCPNGDPWSLARAIGELREQPELLRRMSSNAQSLFERQFRAEHVYGQMQQYLEDVALRPVMQRAA